MKRREFISYLAAAPFALGGVWAAPSLPEALVYHRSSKRHVPLAWGAEERRLLDFIRRQAGACHLHGAPVMARLCGSEPGWINLVASFRAFASVKRDLFAFGVTPISTPELPASMIKFRLGDLVFNLVDAEIESFCQTAYFSAKERKLAFSHNFLVWDVETGDLHDPYGAAPAGEEPVPFRLIGRPASVADAFDWILAGRFEAKFLNLPLSGEFQAFEEETLANEAPEALGRFIAERVVNYFPEIVDRLGLEMARQFAETPLVCGAMRDALGLDFAKVFGEFCKARTPKPRFKGSGVEFISALHQARGLADDFTIIQGDVCRFMVRNNFTFRRPEWLIAPTAVPNLDWNPPALA